MMSNYSNIRTVKQLRRAIRNVDGEINSMDLNPSGIISDLREHYSPSTLVSGFVQRNIGYAGWAGVALKVLRKLRGK